MGHSTAVEIIPASDVTNDSTSSLISLAVDRWFSDSASRYDSPRTGYGFRSEMLAPQTVSSFFNINYDDIAARSVVVPVCAKDEAVISSKKAKMTLNGAEFATWVSKRQVDYMVFAEAYAKFGVHLAKVTVTKMPKARKAVASATEGKSVTRYSIKIADENTVVATGFESQSEARVEAIRIVNSDAPNEAHLTNLEVVGYITRDTDKRALVSISRPTEETVEVEVMLEFATPKRNAKAFAFHVGFDYHH